MRRTLARAIFLLLVSPVSAHRLDEYLQATRIQMSKSEVELAIDLTPGVAIVGQLLPVIDSDHDGRFSTEETNGYARRVLQETSIKLDGKPIDLGLVDVKFPGRKEMQQGLGVIRIRARTKFPTLATGDHVLSLSNHHLPDISVYLVNALVSKDDAIAIDRQVRNERQRDYRLEFRVSPPTKLAPRK